MEKSAILEKKRQVEDPGAKDKATKVTEKNARKQGGIYPWKGPETGITGPKFA